MKRKLFLIKMLKKIATVDTTNYGIMCLQLSEIENELKKAVFDEIITLDEYNTLHQSIEEEREQYKTF